MGLKAQQAVTGDVTGIIRDLQAAYADQWLAHFHFLYGAMVIEGLESLRISELLRARAADELGHAQRLSRRIIELGGELPKWSEIESIARYPHYHYPADPADVDGFLMEVLEAERAAIETYQALLEASRERDPVTRQLAEALLADEIADEDETEALLGRTAHKV